MVRAQISLEFITGVAIMLVIYVTIFSGYKYYTETSIIESAVAENICHNVAGAIDATVTGRSEYYLNTSIPYQVYTKELSEIRVSDNFTLTVHWKDKIKACSIVTNSITNISVYPGKMSSAHIDGKVYLLSIYTNKSVFSQHELPVQITAEYINSSDARVTITDSEGNKVYSNSSVVQQNNKISDIWNPGAEKGTFTIKVTDNSNSIITSERKVTIL